MFVRQREQEEYGCVCSLRQVKRNGRKLAEAFLVKLTGAVYSIELLAELKTGKSDKSFAHTHTLTVCSHIRRVRFDIGFLVILSSVAV